MINNKKLRLKSNYGNYKVFITLVIIIFFFFINIPNRVSGEVQPITEAQEKLDDITEEEKIVLEDLFTLTQEMEELDREEAKLSKEKEALMIKIKDRESLIEVRQKDYDDQLEILKRVLVDYQRSGPASYVDTLLSVGDLRTFLRSINIIRDLTRNVGEFLDSLEAEQKELAEEKETLAGDVALLEEKKVELQVSYEKKQELKSEQENYLETLEEKREDYEVQIKNLEQMWDDIKIQFSKIVEVFDNIISEGYITQEDLNLSIEFPIIKGTIYETGFNEILMEHYDLQGLRFRFHTDKVVIEIPDKHLILEGTFKIVEGKKLKLEVEKGSFYNMPLETASIEELFKDGYLLIDFEKLTGDMLMDFYLQSIKSQEGYLEFKISLVF